MAHGRLGVERVMGLEPTTSTLARSRSTTELHPRPGLPWNNSACGGGVKVEITRRARAPESLAGWGEALGVELRPKDVDED